MQSQGINLNQSRHAGFVQEIHAYQHRVISQFRRKRVGMRGDDTPNPLLNIFGHSDCGVHGRINYFHAGKSQSGMKAYVFATSPSVLQQSGDKGFIEFVQAVRPAIVNPTNGKESRALEQFFDGGKEFVVNEQALPREGAIITKASVTQYDAGKFHYSLLGQIAAAWPYVAVRRFKPEVFCPLNGGGPFGGISEICHGVLSRTVSSTDRNNSSIPQQETPKVDPREEN